MIGMAGSSPAMTDGINPVLTFEAGTIRVCFKYYENSRYIIGNWGWGLYRNGTSRQRLVWHRIAKDRGGSLQ
jgi:hypothetical protein